MRSSSPFPHLDQRFSSPEATSATWDDARALLEGAETYWLSTVRSDGRPHVTPLLAIWLEGVIYFCTGADEQKAKNLSGNPHCVIMTGTNALRGLDVMVEGKVANVREDRLLRVLADRWVAKYGEEWKFVVRDGLFHHEGGQALVYEIEPSTAFGFGKGKVSSQTRWRF